MQNRINSIKEYFVGFNIAENVAYVKVIFPEKWSVTSNEILESNFKVNCVSDNDGGIYFYSDMNNGITNLFDAIDFTIDFNKDMERKSQLFLDKLEQLKSLFSTLSLEELSTLDFVVSNKPNKDKVKTKKRVSKKGSKEVKNIEKETVENELHDETPKNEDEKENIIIDNSKNDNNDSLLAFAEGLVNG